MFHTSISWGGKTTSFEASKECVEDVSLVTPHFIHHSGLNYDHRVSGLESLWPAAVLRLSALLQETKEIIALDRQGTQQQRPESPTVTPPGVRVNTRYKNSTKGTCSKQNKKKNAHSGRYTLHSGTLGDRCVQDYFYSRLDIDLVRRALLFFLVRWLGNLVCFLTLKRCDVWQKRCLPLRGEREPMSSRDVPIFSLDISVSRKDLHVSARPRLMSPPQWETTYIVLSVRNVTPFASTLSQEVNI